ncbi:serpin B6-like [Porites lutea]|uniref:serpin B6-like n=1 Tax=Porites lutea TaxID=51062 RepID=UPI003CC6871E
MGIINSLPASWRLTIKRATTAPVIDPLPDSPAILISNNLVPILDASSKQIYRLFLEKKQTTPTAKVKLAAKVSSSFWKHVLSWLRDNNSSVDNLKEEDVIFGKFDIAEDFLLFDHMLLLGNSGVRHAATVDLHKALKNDQNFTSKNLFYSSSSLSIALAMTYMGAKGDTAGQMAQALRWKAIPQEQLHSEEKQYLHALQETNEQGNELLVANRLFAQKGFSLVQEFVEGTQKYYKAEIAMVDYQKDAEGARKEVNGWVEEKDLVYCGNRENTGIRFTLFILNIRITPGPERIYVSHVIHKAFVEVNEKGTEAAAAIGVVIMSPTGLMMNPIFCVDHPFLFMICHKKSNAILIIGHMLKTQSST